MIESFFESFANGALAVLGISFLIFIHEAGHFVAARLFDVRVETFSIGFGPRLFGWRRRGTDYRVSIIPLGGYVKMAGEYGDLPDDEEPDPGDLMAKPIWQRVVIFSAGVVVNIVFAFLLFPIAFGTGVPFLAPMIGDAQIGGAAWQAGLRPGDVVHGVNGRKVWEYSDIALEVALGDPDDLVFDVERDGVRFDQRVEPTRLGGAYNAGIVLPHLDTLELSDDRKPAEGAELPPDVLHDGDRLLAVNGLRIGEPYRGTTLTPWRALQLAQGRFEPDALTLQVERDGAELTLEHPLTRRPAEDGDPRVIGAEAVQNLVVAVRGSASDSLNLREGDVLLGAPGHAVLRADDLQHLAERGAPLEMRVERDGERLDLVLGAHDVDALRSGAVALGSNQESGLLLVTPGGPLARAGLLDGDELRAVDKTEVVDFQGLLKVLQARPELVDHQLTYARGGAQHSVSVRSEAPPRWELGFSPKPREVVYDLGFGESLQAGFDRSVNTLRSTGLTLGKLFTGEVSADNLGGPVAIAQITYGSAKRDFSQLIHFLALLSVNLGVINILPIPVLDGGQIMFLLFEKVKGGRLSDRFLQNAQLTGLVAILALMVYVTFNDLSRLVG